MPAWLTINDRWCDVREYRRRSQSRETETREKKNKARTYLTPADLFQWRFSRTHTTIPHMPNKKDQMKNTEKKIIILNPFPSPAIKTKPDQTQYFSTNKFHIVVVFHSCARTLDRTHMNHNNNNNKTTAQNCENHSHRQVLALWFSCDRQNVYQAEDRPQVKLLFRFLLLLLWFWHKNNKANYHGGAWTVNNMEISTEEGARARTHTGTGTGNSYKTYYFLFSVECIIILSIFF